MSENTDEMQGKNTDEKLKKFLLEQIKKSKIENLNAITELSSVYVKIVKEQNAKRENCCKCGLIVLIIIALVITLCFCFVYEKKNCLNSYCNKEKILIEQKIKIEGMPNISIPDTLKIQTLSNNENNKGSNSNQATESLTGGSK
jgi:hypothetical protein